MARRRQRTLMVIADIAAVLPWWAGIGIAVVAYASLHAVATTNLPSATSMGNRSALFEMVFHGFATVFQYAIPLALLVGAGLSIFGRHRRRSLLESATNPGEVTRMTWQEFELLVGEAYRRQGYRVTETGLGGADGGIDLILTKPRIKALVQCKHWKVRQVGVKPVRELFGVMTAERATEGILVTSGRFTDEAKSFASSNGITLVDGTALARLVASSDRPTAKVIPFEPRTVMPKILLVKALAPVVLILGGLWLAQSSWTTLSHSLSSKITPQRPPVATKEPGAAPASQSDPQTIRALQVQRARELFETSHADPATCLNWQSEEDMRECANQRIRAKREFLAKNPEFSLVSEIDLQ